MPLLIQPCYYFLTSLTFLLKHSVFCFDISKFLLQSLETCPFLIQMGQSLSHSSLVGITVWYLPNLHLGLRVLLSFLGPLFRATMLLNLVSFIWSRSIRALPRDLLLTLSKYSQSMCTDIFFSAPHPAWWWFTLSILCSMYLRLACSINARLYERSNCSESVARWVMDDWQLASTIHWETGKYSRINNSYRFLLIFSCMVQDFVGKCPQ